VKDDSSSSSEEAKENVASKTIILSLKQTRRIHRKHFPLNRSTKVKLAVTPGKVGFPRLQLRQGWPLSRPVMAPNQTGQLGMHGQMTQTAPTSLIGRRRSAMRARLAG
jgi:hypothetical protein